MPPPGRQRKRGWLAGQYGRASGRPADPTQRDLSGLARLSFWRPWRRAGRAPAPPLPAPIFLDALNGFLFFLRIFSREN